jgi:hypothetical protein
MIDGKAGRDEPRMERRCVWFLLAAIRIRKGLQERELEGSSETGGGRIQALLVPWDAEV